jgi:hypothetical protein
MGRRGVFAVALIGIVSARVAVAQQCPSGVSLPAYAHNDYENRIPLGDALRLGYAGVEADVILLEGDLLVAHSRRRAKRGRGLEDLYLKPLRALLKQCGRILAISRPFLLNVELKEAQPQAYDSLAALLERYPDLLTAYAGGAAAVEVVLVGWHPPVEELSRRGPAYLRVQEKVTRLGGATADSTSEWVRLVSLDYGKTIGRDPARRDQWLAALRRAKARSAARLARVYNVPARRDLYAMLLAAGVDLIGTEKLESSSRELATLLR